jgi:hypothetical protein
VRKCTRMAKILSLLLPVLLVQAVLAVTAQQQQTMKTGSAAAAGGPLNPCVTAPTAPECAKFTYPQASAAADIGSLCKGMHFMASCSVAKACNASGAGPDGDPRGPGAASVSKNNPDICDPFQHVTTVCKLDAGMSRMSGEGVPSQHSACGSSPACVDAAASSMAAARVDSMCVSFSRHSRRNAALTANAPAAPYVSCRLQ